MHIGHLNRSYFFADHVLVAMMFLALCCGCNSAQETEGDITAGVWGGSDGPDEFYWELWQDSLGLGGVIHTVRGGKKRTELPIDRVIWQPPELETHMDATGVVYRGRVDFDRGRISGRLFHGEAEGPEMDLRLTDPDKVAGLRARPPDAGDYTYTQPPTTDDGWMTADCQEVGLSHATLTDLVNAICAGDAGVIHSLLIVIDGRLVVEEYFHGYGRNDLHRVASVTKSVSSLLVGLAIDQGKITSEDASVLSFFPAFEQPASSRWRSQSLRHLLTMSMGLDWGPGEGPDGTGPGRFPRVLEREVIHEPGTHWAYHSANINLLSAVIKEATGQHADVFAEEYLFRPLRIAACEWADEDGYCLLEGGLRLRPRDMAKLGMLLRDEGRWEGRQVVSADWIRRSITPHIDASGPRKYGYLWWVGEILGRDGMQPFVSASGLGGQYIAWFPERDMVLVVTGGNDDNGKQLAIAEVIGPYL